MMKNKISFLINIFLINIFTIKVFSQDCCKGCCENCFDYFYSNKKNIINNLSENNEQQKENNKKNYKQKFLNFSENKENLEGSKKDSEEDIKDSQDKKNYKKSEKEEEQEVENNEEYLTSLLDNSTFDYKIKEFNNDIFYENSNSTDREYTIVTDGTKNNDGVLGKGSCGIVYKVKNKEGKLFALKKVFINKKYEFSTKKEIRLFVKCRDCKNVVKIVDVYKDKNEKEALFQRSCQFGHFYYIITDLYEGGDLNDFIKKCQTNSTGLSNDKINIKKEKYIYQMINAVKQIHDKGILHRDIKPANIFIGKNDKLYLGDFGTATEEYLCDRWGTRGYMNPIAYSYLEDFDKQKIFHSDEKIRNILIYSDLFALSCTIYEILEYQHFIITKIWNKFNAVQRWNSCDKTNIPENLKQTLEKIFCYKKDNDLDFNLFLNSEYYKELNKKYDEKYGI